MNAWNAVESAEFRGPLDVTRAATAVLDAQDVVIGWSPAARQLLGYPPEEVLGRPLRTFLPAAEAAGRAGAGRPPEASLSGIEVRTARHRDGRLLEVALTSCRLNTPESGTGVPARIVVAAPLAEQQLWESQQSMLGGLATQSPVGLGIYDTDLRLTWGMPRSSGRSGCRSRTSWASGPRHCTRAASS